MICFLAFTQLINEWYFQWHRLRLSIFWYCPPSQNVVCERAITARVNKWKPTPKPHLLERIYTPRLIGHEIFYGSPAWPWKQCENHVKTMWEHGENKRASGSCSQCILGSIKQSELLATTSSMTKCPDRYNNVTKYPALFLHYSFSFLLLNTMHYEHKNSQENHGICCFCLYRIQLTLTELIKPDRFLRGQTKALPCIHCS